MANLSDLLKAPRQVEELESRVKALEAKTYSPHEVEALESRIKLLEAYMKAETLFRAKARDALQQYDLPLKERLENALQILASYESAGQMIRTSDTGRTYPFKPTVPDPAPCLVGHEGELYVVFYEDGKATTV